jgi:hypothetical protein
MFSASAGDHDRVTDPPLNVRYFVAKLSRIEGLFRCSYLNRNILCRFRNLRNSARYLRPRYLAESRAAAPGLSALDVVIVGHQCHSLRPPCCHCGPSDTARFVSDSHHRPAVVGFSTTGGRFQGMCARPWCSALDPIPSDGSMSCSRCILLCCSVFSSLALP